MELSTGIMAAFVLCALVACGFACLREAVAACALAAVASGLLALQLVARGLALADAPGCAIIAAVCALGAGAFAFAPVIKAMERRHMVETAQRNEVPVQGARALNPANALAAIANSVGVLLPFVLLAAMGCYLRGVTGVPSDLAALVPVALWCAVAAFVLMKSPLTESFEAVVALAFLAMVILALGSVVQTTVTPIERILSAMRQALPFLPAFLMVMLAYATPLLDDFFKGDKLIQDARDFESLARWALLGFFVLCVAESFVMVEMPWRVLFGIAAGAALLWNLPNHGRSLATLAGICASLLAICVAIRGIPGGFWFDPAQDPYAAGYAPLAVKRISATTGLVGDGAVSEALMVPGAKSTRSTVLVLDAFGWAGLIVIAACILTIAFLAIRAVWKRPVSAAGPVVALTLVPVLAVVSNALATFNVLPVPSFEIPLVSLDPEAGVRWLFVAVFLACAVRRCDDAWNTVMLLLVLGGEGTPVAECLQQGSHGSKQLGKTHSSSWPAESVGGQPERRDA